jgi:GNAT superfamily N-acetyltransferase
MCPGPISGFTAGVGPSLPPEGRGHDDILPARQARPLIIRPYRPADFEPVTDLWRCARLLAFPAVEARAGHTAEEDRRYFREVLQVKNDVWVAEVDGHPAAFMAIAADFIDQLYVAPGHQRQGVGRALIARARQLSPGGLRLFTFQSNASARAFYEKNGFRPARFGVSPPPESEPDVEYEWRP